MNFAISSEHEEIVMKLLHYFITTKNYNPVVLHGAKNEIWLENLSGEYKIIRIVSNYIHNDEQLNFDLYRTKQIMKSIKKKTFSFKVPTLSIFLNLGENVHMESEDFDFIKCLNVKKMDDIVRSNTVLEAFPDISQTLDYKEEGMDLFIKLTTEINQKTEEDAIKAESVFKTKKPVVTYSLIVINVILFLLMYIFGSGSEDGLTLIMFGANQRNFVLDLHQYHRLITSCFLHIGILHLLFNNYALYVIGSQVENFYGKAKYILIYLISGICGNLLSICFHDSITAGASGAIFGLLAAILYFGYHYRLYLGNTLKTQIIPVIVLNLLLGFMATGVDNAAHIGGLISGIFISMVCGVKFKSTKSNMINGIILLVMFIVFMLFLLSNV